MPSSRKRRSSPRLMSERSSSVPLVGSSIQKPSSSTMDESPNSTRKAIGGGSFSTRGCARASSTRMAIARSTSLP